MTGAQEYRHHAEECQQLADQAHEVYVREALGELADDFREMADLLDDAGSSAPESPLALTAKNVLAARRIVASQQERITRLADRGHPVSDHEQMLLVFEDTLELLEQRYRQSLTASRLGNGRHAR